MPTTIPPVKPQARDEMLAGVKQSRKGNDYLKNLDALVQEKKRLAQQKSASRNRTEAAALFRKPAEACRFGTQRLLLSVSGPYTGKRLDRSRTGRFIDDFNRFQFGDALRARFVRRNWCPQDHAVQRYFCENPKPGATGRSVHEAPP